LICKKKNFISTLADLPFTTHNVTALAHALKFIPVLLSIRSHAVATISIFSRRPVLEISHEMQLVPDHQQQCKFRKASSHQNQIERALYPL